MRFLSKESKKTIILIVCCLLLFFISEFFLLNRALSITSNLEERTYKIDQGLLHQFEILDESLISTGIDPSVTFDNIDFRISEIFITCENSIPDTKGQVFYRGDNEPYTESKSVRYETSSQFNKIILDQPLDFQKAPFVSALRFDLTDTPGDIVTCNSFVIKGTTPVKINYGRLLIYLLILIIIIIRTTKISTSKVNYNWFLFMFAILFSIVLGMKLIPMANSSGIIPVVLLSILLFSFSTTLALKFLKKKPEAFQSDATSFWARYRYEILLISIIIVTTLPMLRESYFYYDDWWSVGKGIPIDKESILLFRRPIQSLVSFYFNDISIQDAFKMKWAFITAIILYTLILYRWISKKSKNNLLAFLLAAILGVFEPVMDLIGYSATGAFTFSLLFSSVSVVCFEEAYELFGRKETKLGILYSLFTFILIFTACLAYQIGPQIVFLFFTIELFFGNIVHSIIKKNLAFLVIFASSNLVYLLFVRFLNIMYSVELTTNRSEIIRSIPELLLKIPFYKNVMNQALNQIIVAFTGNQFVLQKYHGYYVTTSTDLAVRIIFYVVVFSILIALFNFWRKTKNWIGLALLLCYIPMSYFVFIILSENGYLTYYAFANISILMFYFLMGFSLSIKFVLNIIAKRNLFAFWQNNDITDILTPLLIISAFISNNYISDFYINFNRSIYNYVKHNLETSLQSGTINRIHVIGKISPITADVYSQFVVETALEELNEDSTDYLITFSGNRDYPTSLPEDVYLLSEGKLTETDKEILGDFYALDLKYRQYNLQTIPSASDRIELRRIFNKSGLIPQAQTPEILVIDISWTTHEYYNQE